MSRKIFLLLCFLLLIPFARAAVLRVPSVFLTIRIAASAASNGDTILLASGFYTDTLSIPTDLTFASNYLLNGDTNMINTTIWRTIYGRQMIDPNYHALAFIGIRFESAEPPVPNDYLISGYVNDFKLDHCDFIGTFNPQPRGSGLNEAAIKIPSRSVHFDFTMTNCRFIGSPNNVKAWISHGGANKVTVTDCYSTGRATNAEMLLDIGAVDTVRVRRSAFHNFGGGIEMTSSICSIIDSCKFIGLTDEVLTTSSGYNPTLVSNCQFDSCTYIGNDFYHIVCIVGHAGISSTIRNSTFTNNNGNSPPGVGLGGQPGAVLMIFQDGLARVLDCEFIHNAFTGPLLYQDGTIRTDGGRFNSCRIFNNRLIKCVESVPLINRNLIHFYTISACDFDQNNIDTLSFAYDSVSAPNCWWGSASGPNYPGNPNGQGLHLSPNTFPVPWRTTPVFPTTHVRDQSTNPVITQYFLTAFPNPFNNQVTIRSAVESSSIDKLFIFDAIGQQVASLIPLSNRGSHVWVWKPQSIASGSYFILPKIYAPSDMAIQINYLK